MVRKNLGLSSLLVVVSLAAFGCKPTSATPRTDGIPILSGSGTVKVTATGSSGSGSYAIDFGSVALGQRAAATLTLSNTGPAPLQILSVGSPTDLEFGITLQVGAVIPQGQSLGVPVEFKPFAVGTKDGMIVVATDSLATPTLTLTFTGVGVALKLAVDPQTVDFGSVVVHTSRTKVVTLTNNSDLGLLITPSAVSGTAAPLFSFDQSAAFNLAAHTSVSLHVTYAPLVPSSSDDAYFTLSLDTGPPVTLSLHGVALQTALLVTPNPLDFNFVQPGQQRTMSLHIANAGNQRVGVASISVTEPSGVFALATGAPQTAQLEAGQSVDVGVVFSPSSAQRYTGSLQIVSNDNLGEQTVPLLGYGGGAAITCAPTTLDFGLAPAHLTTTLPVICTNNGSNVLSAGALDPNAELKIAGFKVSGGSGVFSASIDPQSQQTPLSAGQFVQVDVSYTPAGTENDQATITVESNVTTPPAPPVLNVSGRGLLEAKCYYSLIPAQLDWGQVPPGGNTYTQSFTITNLGPNECLVNGLNLTPGSDSQFTVNPVVSQRLSPPGPGGQFPTQLAVPVTFAPQRSGSYAGTVGLTISDPDAPNVRVPLSGYAGVSCFEVKPQNLNFGVQGVSNGQYCSKAKRSFVGVNGCQTPVTITGVTLSSVTGASPFAFVADTVPVTVAAGQSSPPFQVGFTPTAAGDYFSSAQVQTDLQARPFGVFFKGTAAKGSTATDRFSGQSSMADVLWVMDTDDDYDRVRTEVAKHAQEFMDGLTSTGIDYQVAVTSTDSCGEVNPEAGSEGGRALPCPSCKIDGPTPNIITITDSNAGADLKTLMLMNGTDSICGGSDEQFFEAGYEAIVSGAGATYNSFNNFIRPGAYLALITVNGDPEDDNCRNTVQAYLNQYLSVKGSDHPELFSWSYINPSQPTLPERINSMVRLSGGVHLDTSLPNWWLKIFDLWNIILASSTQFALSGTPDPSTINVYYGGPPPDQVAPGQLPGVLLAPSNKNGSWNWRYVPTANTIQINSQSVTMSATDFVYAEYTLICQ